MKKVFVCEARNSSYHYEEEASIHLREIDSLQDIIDLFSDDFEEAIEILLKDPRFIDCLKNSGYVNMDKIEDNDKKILAGKEFYIYRNFCLEKFNFDRMTDYDSASLADDNSLLLQSINKSSLSKINKPAYDKMIKKRKVIEAEVKRKKEKAAASRERAKQRAIEKARKLLEESGVK